jgi:Na+/melibiose symporter-like transporter
MRTATCSFGSIIGPLFIAHLGFQRASLVVAAICFCTMWFHGGVYLKATHGNHLPLAEVDLEAGSLLPDHNSPEAGKSQRQPVIPPSLYQYSLQHTTTSLLKGQNNLHFVTQSSISHSRPTDRLILMLLSAIMLIYHGVFYVANGWIPTYALLSGFTDSRSKAASLLSAYSTATLCGSILSAFLSVFISKQGILRITFGILGIGSLFLVLINDSNAFIPFLICVITMGLSIGPMYGLILTLPTQLKMKMDSDKTSAIVFGGCIGESILPVFVGWCIGQWGPASFPWSMFLMLFVMLIFYASASFFSTLDLHPTLKKSWARRSLKFKFRPVFATHRQVPGDDDDDLSSISLTSGDEIRKAETTNLMNIQTVDVSII